MKQTRQRGTAKERMQEVLSFFGVSASEFENRCGLAHGFVRNASREISKKTRAKIKEVYPNLNIEYIAMGVGEITEEPGVTRETMKDRIRQFIEVQNITKKEFIHKTGLAESFISRMSDNIRSTSSERILRAYPKLNPEWLFYGEGNMLLDTPIEKSTDTVTDRVERLIEFLGITRAAFMAETGITSNFKNATTKTIDKIVKRYPFVNVQWLMDGTGRMYYTKFG